MTVAGARRQEEVNREVYTAPGVYRYYLSRDLTASEIACLLKYQPYIAGRDVLDIGVGAGRTAHYLGPLARRYEAIDYSPVMVDYVKKILPAIGVHQADFSDLSIFPGRTFDFVFATDNVLDALSHQHRLRALSEAARVLRPGGVLAFSSHNLRYKRALSQPWMDWSSNPLQLARNCTKFALSWRNHIRVGRMRRVTPEYALLNDRGHFHACLHYYAAKSTVRRQIAANGLRFVEAFDTAGRILSDADDDSDFSALLYVAQA